MGQRERRILDHFNELEDRRWQFESHWQEIADNITGRRDFITKRTPGEKRGAKIYDNTALVSGILLASGLHTLLTNTATTWFRLKPEDERFLQDRDVALWFEDAEEVMHNHFNRPEARFMSQMHEVYSDLVHFGTSALWVLDKPGQGVAFSARPLAETFISEDSEGVIDTYFRKLVMTNRQAVDMFGNDAQRASKMVSAGNGEEETTFVHWIRRRDDPDPAQLGSKGMPWASTYIDSESANIVSESGFRELPFLVARWSTDAGEVYGRGPGMTALPAAKMLHQMKKTTLEAAQLQVRPPAFANHTGVLTQLRLQPGGVTYVEDLGTGRPPVTFMDTGSNAGIGIEMIERERVAVRAAYHFELLQLLQDPRMTATQVIELASKMARLLSPILGRMQSEVLEPMIERVFNVLFRQGRFLPPPELLAGQEVKVEYVSPIARAQREGDAAAIIDTFTVAANLSQVDQNVMDNLDSDVAIRKIGNAKGIPREVLRPLDDIQAIRQERAQQQQQQQLIEQVSEASKVIPNIAPLVQGGEGAVQ